MNRFYLWGALVFLLGPVLLPQALESEDDKTPITIRGCAAERLGANQVIRAECPLLFEPNRGQFETSALFVSRGPGYSLVLTSAAAHLGMKRTDARRTTEAPRKPDGSNAGHAATVVDGASESFANSGPMFDWLTMRFVDAKPGTRVDGEEELAGKSNYFIGGDPGRWRTDVPNFARVRYRGIYPGIDLVFHGTHGRLEYDFVLKPGADPAAIRLGFDGFERIDVDDSGDLVLHTVEDQIAFRAPHIYQESDTGTNTIDGRYVLYDRHEVGFQIDTYDRSRVLVIDPVLQYSTYYGGSSADKAEGIAVDSKGNIYITGSTSSDDFPLEEPFQSTIFYGKAFVVKLSPDGQRRIYSTFIGGHGGEYGDDLAVDGAGNAYVVGTTFSEDDVDTPDVNEGFPVLNGFQTAGGDAVPDAFVSKFDPTGVLLYSSYLGSSGDEEARRAAVDPGGNMYVVGTSISAMGDPRFPIKNAFQSERKGYGVDGFATKVDPSQEGDASLVYSTFLSGYNTDEADDISVDPVGNAYITGFTRSVDFPMASARYPTIKGNQDAFVVKLEPSGSAVFSTYLGGEKDDYGSRVVADANGDAYLMGFGSTGFPTTPGAFNEEGYPVHGGGAFIAKMNKLGTDFHYSTHLHPLGAAHLVVDDEGRAIIYGSVGKYDADGNFYFADIFASLNAEGSDTLYTDVLFGQDKPNHRVEDFEIGASGELYLTGFTRDAGFPLMKPIQNQPAGFDDAFIMKVEVTPNVIVVNSTGDEADKDTLDSRCWTGSYVSRNAAQEPECTLRAAIQTANQSPGKTITFDVVEAPPTKSAFSSWPEITQESALPVIRTSMVIDASASPVGLKGKPDIESGLHVQADKVTIKGLRIHSFKWSGIRVRDASRVTIGGSAGADGNTIWRNATGIYVEGAGSSDIVIQGNCIGTEDCTADLELVNVDNVQIGIEVVDGATKTMIGGLGTDEGNTVLGGIVTRGDDTDQITVQQNVLAVREGKMQGLSGNRLELPLDLDDDGPSCTPWTGATEPNGGMPPPRILELARDKVAGITRPNAIVEIYRVDTTGIDRGRYFARHVEPKGDGVADGDGKFEIAVTLSENDLVAATATDEQGNTSELAQVRRPVVFVPGVAGSTLADPTGRPLWLPYGIRHSQTRALANLALLPDGATSGAIEYAEVTGILELYPETARYKVIYGPMLAYLEERGFSGAANNLDRLSLDLWRFPYDWRVGLERSADKLKDLVGSITLDTDDIARSCEVDIVAHSMGGMVSGIYVSNNSKHVQDRVHRFVTIATPYLGTPKVVAAHTMGYIFDLEKEKWPVIPLPVFFLTIDKPWATIIAMARNMPAAYATLPSPNYWTAAMKPGDDYLVDFGGRPLIGHDATFAFMTGAKVDGLGRPHGLGRNAELWSNQQAAVHSAIDDWNDWMGPPQIFRLVGSIANSTAVGWARDASGKTQEKLGTRTEEEDAPLEIEADTPVHTDYRSRLYASTFWGDGTVATLSATLGRAARDPTIWSDPIRPGTDFSGVESSDWIEEFEFFPCKHFPIVKSECTNDSKTKRSLDRVIEILRSGYTALPASQPKTEQTTVDAADHAQELAYIFGSSSFAVHVEDDVGVHTGPVWSDSLMEYGLSEIGYWPNDRATTLSLPVGKAYTVSVVPREKGEVRVVRIRPSSADDNTNLLFPIQELEQGGSITWTADDAGSDVDLEVDPNGDGSTVLIVPPAASVMSTEATPAVPQPQPIRFDEVSLRTDAADPEIVIRLPESGGSTWQWSCETTASWIIPADTSGQTPSQDSATLAATALPLGEHVDTLWVMLAIEGFEASYPVAVRLSVSESLALTAIEVTPRYAAVALGESIQFAAVGLDQRGDPFDFSPSWSATGGSIDDSGLYTAGQDPGSYEVAVTDPASGVRGRAKVTVSSGVGLEDEPRPLPTTFRLYGHYPNPFNPTTTIAYDLPQPSRVTLAAYDVLGRRVSVLSSGTKAAGAYVVTFDASTLPSGVYFYRLEADSFVETKRMVLVK